jgi:hypothetical protein
MRAEPGLNQRKRAGRNRANVVPGLLCTCCQISGCHMMPWVFLRTPSSSLGAGKEKKATTKLTHTCAKPIKRASQQSLTHPRIATTNENLSQERKIAGLWEA